MENYTRRKLMGAVKLLISDDQASNINVLDGWVYYTTGSGPYIFKIREDGSERTQLTEHSSSYVQVIDEWIYYLNQKHLYRINLDGKEQTLIATDVWGFPNIVDGWVYYSKKGSGIYKSKLDGSRAGKYPQIIGRI
jgi:hypothetical protein